MVGVLADTGASRHGAAQCRTDGGAAGADARWRWPTSAVPLADAGALAARTRAAAQRLHAWSGPARGPDDTVRVSQAAHVTALVLYRVDGRLGTSRLR